MNTANNLENKIIPFQVIIEGNIGSGKSTFLNHFIKNDKVDIYMEPILEWQNLDNINCLDLAMNNPSKYFATFQSYIQLTMLNNHIHQSKKQIKIIERSIHSSRYIFVEAGMQNNYINEMDYKVLDKWFQWNVEKFDVSFDLFVYLRADPKVCFDRMKIRNRTEDAKLSLSYIEQLHKLHDDWFLVNQNGIKNVKILIIDANKSTSDVKNHFIEYMKTLNFVL